MSILDNNVNLWGDFVVIFGSHNIHNNVYMLGINKWMSNCNNCKAIKIFHFFWQ
jgi:hypothetical protein